MMAVALLSEFLGATSVSDPGRRRVRIFVILREGGMRLLSGDDTPQLKI